MIDRRMFLAGATAATLAPASAHAADPDVVVVGAGAAGLAAAHAMKDAGRKPLVLEARDRLGGRAYTDRSLGPVYDAGAMYIHWAERNPWVEIARQLGVPTTEEPWGGGFRVYADGRPMSETDRLKRRGVFGEISKRLDGMNARTPDRSILDLLADLGPDMQSVAASGLLLSIGEESARISARDYQRLWAGEDLIVPSGYGDLVARSAAGLDIRINEPVLAIDWSGAGVAVTTRSGTIRAKACIVTVPLGVLQAEAIHFTPALPAATRDAMGGMGMGALTKLALKVEGGRFGIEAGASLLEAGSPGALMNFDMFPGDQDLVIAYCGGDHARELSKAGPDAAREQVVDLLARMIGSDVRKAVTAASFPAWWTDPWSRGSYSVCRPGRSGDREALARPVGERIWLAGEATAGGGAMTVGGATLAGRAAAAALLRLKA